MDDKQIFEFENQFYLNCSPQRISKFICHYELFKRTLELPGDLAEFGVFKGASLSRFAMMRNLFCADNNRRILGFDIFGTFPETQFEDDQSFRDHFIQHAGADSIPVEALRDSLERRQLADNVELIAGDIVKTLPKWLEKNPQARFSLVNLDTDIYEPAVAILERTWPRLVNGGVLILDDYAVFPGETQAVDEFFDGTGVTIRRFPHAKSPSYVIKGE